jgi:hypothetical protein
MLLDTARTRLFSGTDARLRIPMHDRSDQRILLFRLGHSLIAADRAIRRSSTLPTRLGSSGPGACSFSLPMPSRLHQPGEAGLLQSVADRLDGGAHTAAVRSGGKIEFRNADSRLYQVVLYAEADGNRTRRRRGAPSTSFEDWGGHQAP